MTTKQRKLLVLDLFCGLGGWSQAFKERGHKVVTLDYEQKFNPTICADVLAVSAKDLTVFGVPDVVLASPPCQCFSMLSVYRHWKDHKPKDDVAELIRELATLKTAAMPNPHHKLIISSQLKEK